MLYLFGFFKKNINIYIYIQLKCDGRSVKLFFWPDQRNIINSYVYIYNSSGDFNVTCCLAWWYDTPSNWARALNCQAVLGSPSARCWTPGEGDGERERDIYTVYIYIVITTITIVYVHQLIDIQAAPPCRVNSTWCFAPQEARRLRSELWEERSAAASAAVVAAGGKLWGCDTSGQEKNTSCINLM